MLCETDEEHVGLLMLSTFFFMNTHDFRYAHMAKIRISGTFLEEEVGGEGSNRIPCIIRAALVWMKNIL